MTFSESLVFYLVVGLGVAVAHWSTGTIAGKVGRTLTALAAVPFWPLFLPLLLSRDRGSAEPTARRAPNDELARAVAEVETELCTALTSLAGERGTTGPMSGRRLTELHEVLAGQADRIRRMDEVLARSGPDEPAEGAVAPEVAETSELDRDRASRLARRANLLRLADLRRSAEVELRTNLERIRELVSQAHLVEFSGAPPGRAEALLAEIAAVVEKMASQR